MSIRGVLVFLVALADDLRHYGPVAALLVLVAGLTLLLLGYRAFRPTAALLAALVAAHAMTEAMDHGELRLKLTQHTAMWLGGVVAFPLALIWPAFSTVAASAGAAFFIAMRITPRNDPDMALFIWTGAIALGALVPAVLWNFLPALIVPIVGSAFTTLGAWAYLGIHHSAWHIYNVPAVWIAFWAVIAVASGSWETKRIERAHAKKSATKGSTAAAPAGDARPRPKAAKEKRR